MHNTVKKSAYSTVVSLQRNGLAKTGDAIIAPQILSVRICRLSRDSHFPYS
jgi:hypothetical protein